MASHVNHKKAALDTKKTLYLVAGFYVAVGFVAAGASALQGDRLGTFLGFLIISGALAAGVLIRAAIRIGLHVSAVADSLDAVRWHLDSLERLVGSMAEQRHDSVSSGGIRIIDLAAIGSGDPTVLSAVTLDRTEFPRLVTTMNDEPPAQAAEGPRENAEAAASDAGSDDAADAEDRTDEASVTAAPATRNLLRQWKIALREGDVAACRAVFSTLVDTAESADIEPLRAQLENLAHRTELSLRTAFAAQVRAGDFEAALMIGRGICDLFPDQPVAEEFNRIRPHLERRLERDRPSASSAIRLAR